MISQVQADRLTPTLWVPWQINFDADQARSRDVRRWQRPCTEILAKDQVNAAIRPADSGRFDCEALQSEGFTDEHFELPRGWGSECAGLRRPATHVPSICPPSLTAPAELAADIKRFSELA
jgi:hypothetical protein